MRVLYVEDNALDADLTKRHLRKSAPDIELDVVATISEALLRLRAHAAQDYDLVLTDLNLPDGEGLALYGQIRARNWHLPVVVITGLGDDVTVSAALRAGASDYVVKREDYLDKLPATLRDAVERFKDERERQGQPLRVLYAEDDNETFELTSRQFARQAPNIRLQRVTTGAEVLQRLSDVDPQDLPDVLLLDYQLSDQNGLELLRALRIGTTSRVPSVVITAFPEEEIALGVFKFGASDYLVKSAGYLTRLPRVLESVAYRAQLQREQEALHESQQRLQAAYGEARRQLADQRMLFETGQVLSAAQTEAEVWHIVCERMLDYIGATSSSMVTASSTDEVVLLYHLCGAEASDAERVPSLNRPFSTSEFPHWEQELRAGRLYQAVAGKSELAPAEAGAMLGRQCKRLVIVPLIARGRQLAIVILWDSRNAEPVPDQAAQILVTIGSQAALKLENLQLVSRLETAAHEATELARAAQSASQLKSDFLANTSHELRSPLTAMQSALSMVLDDMCQSPEEERHWLSMSYAASEQLQRFISDLLDFAQIEAGRVRLETQDFDLQLLIEEVVARNKTRAHEKGLALIVNYPAGPRQQALVDYTKARRVLDNLIDNAIKFTDHGHVSISVEPNVPSGFVDIIVADSGLGIPVEMQTQVLEPFVQVDSSSTRAHSGFGLGLSMARRLTELMGGSLLIASPGVDQGTNVTLRLPLAVG